jgi:hypothetical protein
LFFPLFPWIFQLAVIAFTICVALYLATTGEPQYKIRGMANSTCPCSAQGYKVENLPHFYFHHYIFNFSLGRHDM